MKFRLTHSAAVISALFAQQAIADTQDTDQPTELQSVVVSANRFMTPLEKAPGQIEVVRQEELSSRKNDRLSDVIKYIPSLTIQPGRGPTQSTQAMSLRGIPDERRMLVMVDGIPVNDGYAGSVNLSSMPTEILGQAEVMVGPMSSLYGGTAMSGVVNFTTLMPKAPMFNASFGYGAPFSQGKAPEDTRKLSLSGGTLFANGLSVLVGGNWMATEGYKNEDVTTTTKPAGTLTGWSQTNSNKGATAYLIGNKGATAWEENGQYLKLEQRLNGRNKWRAGWQRQAYEYSNSNPETYVKNSNGTANWNSCTPNNSPCTTYLASPGGYERNIYSLGGDIDVLDGLLKVTAAYIDVSSNYFVSPSAPSTNGINGRISDSASRSTLVDGYWSRQFGKHGLTLGSSWRHDRAHNTEYSLTNWHDTSSQTKIYASVSGEADSLGIYGQDEWQITDRLLAHLGLRYDYWKNTNGRIDAPGWTAGNLYKSYPSRSAEAFNPKVALRYEVTPTLAVRTSYGSAFRAPSVYELYRTGRIGSTTYSANPDLKPETVTTFDVGADIKPWQGGEIKLTAFSNRMEDLIYTQGSGSVRNRVNAELAVSQGIIVGLTQQISHSTRLVASYTKTNSEVKKNSSSVVSEGKDLSYVPQHQATLGLDSRLGDWTLAGNLRYASKQYSTDDNSDVANKVFGSYDAYTIVDARVAYRIDKHVTTSLAVDNLLDREYYSYYTAPRRSWFAAVNYAY